MAHDHDMSVTQMYWQPPLMALTYVAHPDVDDGWPTKCFVAPQLISGIGRQSLAFSKTDPQLKGEWHKVCTATAVTLTTNGVYYVKETPEEVAMMRDKALGFEPPTKKPPATVTAIGTGSPA